MTLANSAQHSTFSNNVFDLASSGLIVSGFMGAGGHQFASNVDYHITGNIFIADFSGSESPTDLCGNGVGYDECNNAIGTNVTIANNIYHNYVGSDPLSTGNSLGDSNPIHEDPGLSGWTYTLSASSPARNSPVNFTDIPGGWGPPGFVIPQTGTPPSVPH
jgi:hypothetical protein